MGIIHKHFPRVLDERRLLEKCVENRLCDEEGKRVNSLSGIRRTVDNLSSFGMIKPSGDRIHLSGNFYSLEY